MTIPTPPPNDELRERPPAMNSTDPRERERVDEILKEMQRGGVLVLKWADARVQLRPFAERLARAEAEVERLRDKLETKEAIRIGVLRDPAMSFTIPAFMSMDDLTRKVERLEHAFHQAHALFNRLLPQGSTVQGTIAEIAREVAARTERK